jgi:hypothetical protein
MKKNKIISLLLFSLLVFTGCEDYLDLGSKNQLAVKKFEDIQRVLAGYLYSYSTSPNQVYRVAYPDASYDELPILAAEQYLMFSGYSDDLDFESNLDSYLSSSNSHQNTNREGYYGTQLLWNNFDQPKLLWDKFYSVVGFMNGMIDRMEQITDGDPDERNQLLGEVYLHRAYHLFKLLEWFAPYDNAELGIPVYLNTGKKVVGISNPRKSQSEVYAIILEDLNKALDLYNISGTDNNYNQWFKIKIINNLLADVYWYKAESAAKESSDYENAKIYAKQAIKNIDQYIPTTTNGLYNLWANQISGYPGVYIYDRLFASVAKIYGSPFAGYGQHPANLRASADLAALFEPEDIRRAAYFDSDGITLNYRIIDGAGTPSKKMQYHVFMPEHAYLILAEANLRMGNDMEALNVLNSFRSFRNVSDLSGISGDQLLQEIFNERRREFFTKADMRWIDLKRHANKTILRSLTLNKKTYDIEVKPNDYRYALPIPLEELRENPELIPNEGWTLIEF